MISDRKITTYVTNIVDLSDNPNGDGLTADQLKAKFDGRTDAEVKNMHNGLIDDLESTTDGSSGADNIGTTPVGEGTAETVQGVLEELDSKIDTKDSEAVHLTGNESVSGVKTFSSSPIVPQPTTDGQASNKKYADDLNDGCVHKTSDESINGEKTFSGNLKLLDGVKLYIGTSGQVYIQEGSGLTILGSVSAGNFTLQNFGGTIKLQTGIYKGVEVLADDAGVKLYYNGNYKLLTTNNGVEIVGELSADALKEGSVNLEDKYIQISTNDSITGIKTFSSSPIVPTPTTDMQATTKKYVDNVDDLKFDKSGGTITGETTFELENADYENQFYLKAKSGVYYSRVKFMLDDRILKFINDYAKTSGSGIDTETLKIDFENQRVLTSGSFVENGLLLTNKYVKQAGDSMTGNLTMSGNKVSGVADPTVNTDAATMGWVQSQLAALHNLDVIGSTSVSATSEDLDESKNPTSSGDTKAISAIETFIGSYTPVLKDTVIVTFLMTGTEEKYSFMYEYNGSTWTVATAIYSITRANGDQAGIVEGSSGDAGDIIITSGIIALKDGSATDARIGNRTVDQGIAAAYANTGSLTQIFSWLAKRFKAILGTTNWYDDVPISLTGVGALSGLATTIKTSIVSAINELANNISDVVSNIGDLGNLNTTIKTSIVNAINELLSLVNDNADETLFYEVYSCSKDNRADPDRILRCTLESHDSSIVISGDRFFRR